MVRGDRLGLSGLTSNPESGQMTVDFFRTGSGFGAALAGAAFFAGVLAAGAFAAALAGAAFFAAGALAAGVFAAGALAAGVFAAGDCASFESRRFGRRLRVEHWDVALHQPEVIAANVLGGDEVYDPVPYFWSEQFGRMVQYVGHHGGAESLLWRGDPAEPTWSACWLAAGRLVAR